ncbi:MAG: methylenetetrahydrofolate reductase [Planctomycetes bacterium]|nr:methylenetetrahydrofolate reductase [Planctomycetota bacterium]
MIQNNGNPRSGLEAALQSGEFVATIEILPPRIPTFGPVDQKLSYLAGLGRAINVTDNASAAVKMSSLAVCTHLVQRGEEPVLQITCRDRNRLAIQSDVLGALALGVRNIFCVTGDHISFGDHPGALPVFDLDSVQLVQVLQQLRERGVLASGIALSESKNAPSAAPPSFFLGAAANPFGDPLPLHVIKLAKKIAAGADFIQTQCVFDLVRMREFMGLVRERGLHRKAYFLAGVMPVRSVKTLQFLQKNVPGMRIPPALLDRMTAAEKPEDEGVRLAAELVRELRAIPGIAGVHIMTPQWEKSIPRVIELSGLFPSIAERKAHETAVTS